jgi:hypothetical protein
MTGTTEYTHNGRVWRQTAGTVLHFTSVTHALYQAAMWRRYAMVYDGIRNSNGGLAVPMEWVRDVMKMTRQQCLDKAWEAARAAKILNDGKRASLPC